MTARRTRAKKVRANYPGKRVLTWAEAESVLRHGPLPAWFQPWAERGVILPGLTRHGYGYLHVYSVDGSFQYDFAAWADQEGLNWGLESLYKGHSRCDDCRGVLYFVPDQPLKLRIVIEKDDLPRDDEVDE